MNRIFENEDDTKEYILLDGGGVPVKSVTTDRGAGTMEINWEQMTTNPSTWPPVSE